MARMASSSVMLRTIHGIFANPASSLARWRRWPAMISYADTLGAVLVFPSANTICGIFVNNPYFNEMRFQVNSSSIDITPPPSARPGMPARCNPETNVEYRNCKKLGEEIRQALTQVRKDVREKIEQAAAPKAAVTCPYCGATTTPDASGCCEYCGGAVNG